MKHIRLSALCLALGASMASHAAPMTVAIGQSQYFAALNKNVTIQNINGVLSYSVGQFYDGIECDTVSGMIDFNNELRINTIGNNKIAVKKTYTNCNGNPDIFLVSGTTISAKAKSLTIDDITGTISDFRGIEAGTMVAPINGPGLITGGTYSATNIRASLDEASIFGDVIGNRYAVGTKPATPFNTTNRQLWTYKSVTGPKTFPLNSIKSSTNIPATLTQAGFTVISATSNQIIFQGHYKFSVLFLTKSGISAQTSSLGLLSSGINGLTFINSDQSAEPFPSTDPTVLRANDGYGELDVTVTFSMPLTP